MGETPHQKKIKGVWGKLPQNKGGMGETPPNYLARALILRRFLWSLLTRFLRHFQRIFAVGFLNLHEWLIYNYIKLIYF